MWGGQREVGWEGRGMWGGPRDSDRTGRGGLTLRQAGRGRDRCSQTHSNIAAKIIQFSQPFWVYVLRLKIEKSPVQSMPHKIFHLMVPAQNVSIKSNEVLCVWVPGSDCRSSVWAPRPRWPGPPPGRASTGRTRARETPAARTSRWNCGQKG